jgi:putative N6-adenine-specific DNA methylase
VPHFVSLVPKGLSGVHAEELQSLGLKKVSEERGQVHFESNWESAAAAIYRTRISSRVILPVLDFEAYSLEELYRLTQKHDFTKYIDVSDTLAVDCEAKEPRFGQQQIITLKIKDAVVDQFWEKYQKRPSVDRLNPTLKISVRVVRQKVSLAIDLCGVSLSHRGYRTQQGGAPLRENLASGLLALANASQFDNLVDPMCGSGTILIEAALAAQEIWPGDLRSGYAIENLKTTGEHARKALADLRGRQRSGRKTDHRFFGYDHDAQMIRFAKANAKRAGVEDLIRFEVRDIVDVPCPAAAGLIVTNPPYARRMGERNSVERTWKILGQILHSKFKGWEAWVLCGDEALTPRLHLKATRKAPVFNGDLECRFLRYEIHDGDRRPAQSEP